MRDNGTSPSNRDLTYTKNDVQYLRINAHDITNTKIPSQDFFNNDATIKLQESLRLRAFNSELVDHEDYSPKGMSPTMKMEPRNFNLSK